jgi:hypothetical protein
MKINHAVQFLIFMLCAFTTSQVAAAESDAQQAALYYAGLDEPSAERKVFQTQVKRAWKNYDGQIGKIMSGWAQQEVGYAGGGEVFYPFSGPDFLTIDRMYPNADRYVLVALQKALKPSYADSMDKPARADFEKRLGAAWNQLGRLGYFRTEDLDEDQHKQHNRIGATTILMAFAALQGYEVLAVNPIAFNASSGAWELNSASDAKWSSVRLVLRKNARQVTLDYVSLDLSNGGLHAQPEQAAWLQTMAAHPTLLKAASHLLQEPYFSNLRDMIVKAAPVVVQDETGLKYTDLAKIGKVTLYGNFVKPLAMFKKTTQPALAEAYAAAKDKKKLPFAFSYLKNSEQRSVQIVRRVAAVEKAVASTSKSGLTARP